MSKISIALFILTIIIGNPQAGARSDCNVQVDCATHEVTVLGRTSRIDCGKPGHRTHNGVGRIGGYHHGRRVPNGVKIEGIAGMGSAAGGRVFHSVSWGPKGLNDSRGCIHVTPQTRDVLHTCQGSRLVISGATSGYESPRGLRYTRHQHRRRQNYRMYSEPEYRSSTY